MDKIMNVWDYLNAINMSKKELIVDEATEKAYVPFVVNRTLSYFPDTVLLANEMNLNAHLDNKPQFDFFISTVRRRKRFSKWAKPSTESDLEVIKEYYGYSNEKARQALTLLSDEQLKYIKEKVQRGGTTRTKK
jgi:hypothetical protein